MRTFKTLVFLWDMILLVLVVPTGSCEEAQPKLVIEGEKRYSATIRNTVEISVASTASQTAISTVSSSQRSYTSNSKAPSRRYLFKASNGQKERSVATQQPQNRSQSISTTNSSQPHAPVELYDAQPRPVPRTIHNKIQTDKLDQQEVLSTMKKVANWQLALPDFTNPTTDLDRGWRHATLYIGIMELARLSGDSRYLNTLLEMGNRNGWNLGPRIRMADDDCVGQVYCELFFLYRNQSMILPMQSMLNEIVTNPPIMNNLTYSHYEWTESGKWLWADSLFMAPPTFMRLYNATGDAWYLDFVINNWWIVSNFLYDSLEHLFFRDSRFINVLRPKSGKKIFWSRGNGWAMAGLVRVLQYLPKNHPSHPQFIQQLQEMAEKILALQQPDGLWRTDLLDPTIFPLKETSGTALLTYAITWGINQGFLNKTIAQPAMFQAWSGLVSCINSSGKLGYVQSANYQPANVTSSGTQAYAIGAFLLAGSEVYRMIGDV